MKMKRLVSIAMALLLISSLPVTAFAADWYLEDGSITVSADNSGQTVTQGSAAVEDAAPVIKQRDSSTATTNTVTITAAENQTANVTLSGVNIDVSGTGSFTSAGSVAVSTGGDGSVTIELDGTNTVRSGYQRAGLEKNNTGSLTIINADEDEDGSLIAQGGDYGAGIGGGLGGSGSDITLSGGEINATGGWMGAGIGGGLQGSGSDITISGSKVTATGGNYAAGIGGGKWGNGSNIRISDADVNAKGGNSGAGIGGGMLGNGSNINLSGSKVTATSGELGAGIGGGWNGSGSNITISGGTTKAAGGIGGAGIGGGQDNAGSDITVSGNAQLKVQGGEKFQDEIKEGAAIGNGGTYFGEGTEVEPDVSELTPEGKIEYYAPGANMEKDAPIEDKTIIGKYVPETEPDEIEADTQSAPLYRVTDKDGRDVTCKAEQKNGVLTVTVDADFAVLTGTLYGINTLKTQGVEKIVFVTKSAKSTFALADLLEKGSRGETYKLTHDGKTVTFTLGAKNTDVSDILKKA